MWAYFIGSFAGAVLGGVLHILHAKVVAPVKDSEEVEEFFKDVVKTIGKEIENETKTAQ